MVRIVEQTEELNFLPADPYAARITALAETYGTRHSFASFWIQTDEVGPVAGICRVDGNMTVCVCENADYSELSAFVDAVGYSSLTCDAEVMKKLGREAAESSFTVEYMGGSHKNTVEKVFDCDKRKIYELLCTCGFELGDYSAFLTDICARLNKKTASLIAVEGEDMPGACAFALFEGKKSVLLGAVATNPADRGKGYASEIVGALAQSKSDKKVFLFCRNDSLADFYSRIGFCICGKWAIHKYY